MRYAVWGLRRGSGTGVRIRASALAPVPSKGAVPHSNGLRTRHLHPGPHSVPYGTWPLLVFLWRISKKAARWLDPSLVLGSGPSRTNPSHPGIAFAGRAMPTMKGTVQEDDYRTEVRFKNTSKKKNVSLLRFMQNPDPQYCGSGTRIRT